MIKKVLDNKIILLTIFLISFFWYYTFIPSESHINEPPTVFDTELSTREGAPLSIDIMSLIQDPKGEKIRFATIVDLPKNGNIALQGHNDGIYKNTIFYNFSNETKLEEIKFDPARIRLQYLPNNKFIGTDSISFIAFDSSGNKSKQGKVKISVNNLQQTKNYPPIVKNLEITITTNDTLNISLDSLTFDPDAELLVIYNEMLPIEDSFKMLDFGLLEGRYNINYLPQRAGIEFINFLVSDNTNEARRGTIKITTINAPPNYSSDLKSKVFNLTDYFANLPIPKANMLLMLMGWCIFIFVGVIFFILRFLSIKNTLVEGFFEIIGNNHIVLLILILNSCILFYHVTSPSLPGFTLDYAWLKFYYHFRDGIFNFVHSHHRIRVLIPYLASLIPINDALLAFKIINTIFFNCLLIVLYKIWKSLEIKTYLYYLALFLLVCGPIRFYNFWPTQVDAQALFFAALLLYIVLRQQYLWLIIVAPIASLQHEIFLLYLLILLFYHIFNLFAKLDTSSKKINILYILLSILVLFLAKVIPNSVYPQVNTDIKNIVFIRGYFNILKSLEYGFLEFIKLPIVYFGVFGATLMLIFKKKNNFKSNEFINITSFFIIGYLLVLLIVQGSFNTRSVFLIFPFVVTLILYRLNDTSFVLIILSVFISLPLMRLVGFPFLEPVELEAGSNDYLSLVGLYIIFSTALLYYIKDTKLLLIIENYSCKILARITSN